MDTTKSPPGSVRRAGRNISHPMPRRSTIGPLDSADDPLATTTPVQRITSPVEAIRSDTTSITQSQPEHVRASSTKPLPVQLRFLRDPRLYHQIPIDDVLRPFVSSPNQPDAASTLADLLRHGHFRRAAEKALDELLHAPIEDGVHLFELLYCRLACLTLIARLDVAADEALPLSDFLSSNAPSVQDVIPLVPWPLRIILVRLQSVAAHDGGRRVVMALYALASEVREHIRDARSMNDKENIELWSTRLIDIGLRVSDTLVEMGELETADRHLTSLVNTNKDEILLRRALLHLRTGNVAAAASCVSEVADTGTRSLLEALMTMSNADPNISLASWQSLSKRAGENDLAIHNQAIFLLYTGHIEEASQLLEKLTDTSLVYHTLLFNLSTMYELCSERAAAKKLSMAEKLAARRAESSVVSWERSIVDLKL